jgi:hypothetical protein
LVGRFATGQRVSLRVSFTQSLDTWQN